MGLEIFTDFKIFMNIIGNLRAHKLHLKKKSKFTRLKYEKIIRKTIAIFPTT